MSNPPLAEVEFHKVPRGMTRQTMLSGWNFPLIWLVPVIGVPALAAFVNRNVLWLALIIPAVLLARRLADDKDNNPRVLWLAIVSGSYFATKEGGAEVIHPLDAGRGRGLGMLHD